MSDKKSSQVETRKRAAFTQENRIWHEEDGIVYAVLGE